MFPVLNIPPVPKSELKFLIMELFSRKKETKDGSNAK